MKFDIQVLLENVDSRTVECNELNELDMMSFHGPMIWKTQNFIGTPHFYPIYRYQDMFSYSLLSLILKKGTLKLDKSIMNIAKDPNFSCMMSNQIIDCEIERIGKPHKYSFEINDVDDFANQIAKALCDDIKRVENANPNYTNLVLCGGKDSLNLLLLPWENNVIALSADPNYTLVKTFIERNELDIPLIKLKDEFDSAELENEILECCCRAELSNWRWGASLQRIVSEMDKKVVLWKGQAGDLYMSTTWKTYMHPVEKIPLFFRKVYKKTSDYLPNWISREIGELIIPSVVEASWNRTASLQGSHMGFLRAITDSLVVSAYHGPEVIKVWERANFAVVSQFDMRPKVGEILAGRNIIYPSNNPAPTPSSFRKGLSNPKHFLDLIRQTNVRIENQ